MLAWLSATTLLRQPIRVVAVDDSGAAPALGDDRAGATINDTYDKVDLQSPRHSISGRHPPPALLMGVGGHGCYADAIAHADGEFRPAACFGGDKSAGNLLHVLVNAG